MIEQGLIYLLANDATLAGLVGTRIFPVLVPPSTPNEPGMPVNPGDPPCLSYQVVSNHVTYSLETKEHEQKRIQFDAWAITYAAAKSVKTAVRNVLDGYTGILSDGTRVLSASRSVEIDFWESEARVYRLLFEYIFRFVEP